MIDRPNQPADKNAESIASILALLKDLTNRPFYGRVEIIIKGGRIVWMDKVKNYKFD